MPTPSIVDQDVKVVPLPLCLQNSLEVFDKRVKRRAVGKIELKGRRFIAVFSICFTTSSASACLRLKDHCARLA
jgi:hypothetical protein